MLLCVADENASVDAQPARAWRLPAWTWIILHFAFVASLAFVHATSCPWVRRGRLPGNLEDVNHDHGTALIKFENAGDGPQYALLDIATLNVTHPVVDAKEAYGKSVFLPADRRAVIREWDSLHDCSTYRVADLDDGLAYPLLPELPFDSATLDGSGERVFISSDFQTVPPDVASRTKLDVLTGERGEHAAWLYDDSGIVVTAQDGRVMCRKQGKHAGTVWSFRARLSGPSSLALSPDSSYVATLPAFGGSGHLLDARSGREIRRITVDAVPIEPSWFQVAMFGLGGQRLIAVSRVGTVKVTETVTGRMLADIWLAVGASYVSVSTDGRRLAARMVGEIVIVDLETGGVLARVGLEDEPLLAVESVHGLFSDDFLIWGRDVFRRRFPEWWWGHFYRPEVWAAIVIGAVWLWTVARWARGRMRERRAAESGPTPATA
jgi:hypothetical protein